MGCFCLVCLRDLCREELGVFWVLLPPHGHSQRAQSHCVIWFG